MGGARRVPWSNRGELSELYEMIFGTASDIHSRQAGLARMNIYISSPSCPTFIHLLHSLLAADLYLDLDRHQGQIQYATNISARMMMASAIVRFVNGLVDPLQTGPYARPISHIASSLGLPPSIVALRHRATHEDLPPLSLLVKAIRECISFIHYNSFLPFLSPPHSSSSLTFVNTNGNGNGNGRRGEKRKEVEDLILNWKKVQKGRLRTKEVREEDDSGRLSRKLKKDLMLAFQSDIDFPPSSEVEGDRGVVVEVLCKVGSLIPVARKKRPSKKSLSPTLSSKSIWLPILEQLSASSSSSSSSTSFATSLSSHILSTLLLPSLSNYSALYSSTPNSSLEGQEKEVESARWALATWLLYLWSNNPSTVTSNINSDEHFGLSLPTHEKMGIWKKLLSALLAKHDDVILRRLVNGLISIDPTLQQNGGGITDLLPPLEAEAEEEDELVGLEMDADQSMEIDDGLDEMEKRLKAFQQRINQSATVDQSVTPSQSQSFSKKVESIQVDNEDVPGWHRLTEDEWKPCPIGIWSGA